MTNKNIECIAMVCVYRSACDRDCMEKIRFLVAVLFRALRQPVRLTGGLRAFLLSSERRPRI